MRGSPCFWNGTDMNILHTRQMMSGTDTSHVHPVPCGSAEQAASRNRLDSLEISNCPGCQDQQLPVRYIPARGARRAPSTRCRFPDCVFILIGSPRGGGGYCACPAAIAQSRRCARQGWRTRQVLALGKSKITFGIPRIASEARSTRRTSVVKLHPCPRWSSGPVLDLSASYRTAVTASTVSRWALYSALCEKIVSGGVPF